ncbi:MAG: aquaporin [Acidimicrobiia bacterium]|jgi:aquaporin Z
MVINKYLAEVFGTFILVLIGGATILAAGATQTPGLIVVPFGFGLGLMAAIYAVGHVSGGHFNPAVSLAMYLDKRLPLTDLAGYWTGQLVGGLMAASVLFVIGGSQAAVGATTSAPGAGVSSGEAFVVEAVLTWVFVWVILASTKKAPAVAGMVISLTLAVVHFAGIPFSGSSVNPARSFGPAIISGENLGVLWVYLVAPLVGGAFAWLFWRLFGGDDDEASVA